MSDKCCQICYNKKSNDTLKCKQCKNSVCDVCYASIIFNNEKFNDDYMNNKTTFKCAFCKFENVFSTTINNYNTNDKLIKLLINKNNKNAIDDDDDEDDDLTNTRVDNAYTNALIHNNNSLCIQIDELKKKLHESTLANKQYETAMKDVISKLKKIEEKTKNKPDDKLKQIENIIQNTKRRTMLYDEIYYIIHN